MTENTKTKLSGSPLGREREALIVKGLELISDNDKTMATELAHALTNDTWLLETCWDPEQGGEQAPVQPSKPAQPAEWAIERALEAYNSTRGNNPRIDADAIRNNQVSTAFKVVILAYAAHIEEHDEAPAPPVDPDLLIARQVVSAAWEQRGWPVPTAHVLAGDYDDDDWVSITLDGIKLARKLGTLS